MNLSNNGSLFNLQASLTLNTQGYESSIDEALADIEALDSAIQGVDGSDITLSVDDDEVGEAEGSVEDLTGSLETADDAGDLELTADAGEVDEAVSTVDGLTSTLDDADSASSLEVSADSSEAVDATADVDDLTDSLEEADAASDITITVDSSEAASAGSDIDEVTTALGGINTASGTASGGIESLTSMITDHLAGVATVSAIASVASAVVSLAGNFSSTADNIDKESQRMGMSYEKFQEWTFILSQNGSSIESLKRGMSRLRESLADPNGEFSDGIASLGLSVEELQGMDSEQAFSAIVTGLQNIQDPEEKAAAAMGVFGRQMGTELAPLLNQTAKDTDELRQKAHDLGLIMSDEAVKSGVKYTDSLDALNRSWDALKNNFIEGIVPAITTAMDGLTSLISKLGGEDNSLSANVERVTTTFTNAITSINDQELNAQAIIDAMDQLGDPDTFTEEDAAMWDAYYQKLVEVVPGIAEKFGEHATAAAGVTDALRQHAKAIIDDAKAAAVAQAISAKQQAMADALERKTDAEVEYNMAKNKAASIEESAEYQSWLAKTRSWEAQYGNLPAELQPALNYSDAEWKAWGQYNDTLAEMKKAQKELEEITSDTEAVIADSELWINTLYEIAGIKPFETVEESTTESLTTMVEETKSAVEEINAELDNLNGTRHTTVTVEYAGNFVPDDGLPGHKNGLDYVPYDNYVARLHKGERVLTESENQAYMRGGSDVEALAAAIANRPISFSVGDTELATSISTASSRANAQRAAAISSGYGRGLR